MRRFTLEPELICSWSNKKIIKNSKTFSKNSEFFWWWTYTCFLHTCKKIHEMTCPLLCAKKTNSLLWKHIFKSHFGHWICLFLHRAAKMLFHHEILHVCKKHVYVHHQKNLCFTIFPEFFIGPGAGELGSQNASLLKKGLLSGNAFVLEVQNKFN